jgi:hypothetical protein
MMREENELKHYIPVHLYGQCTNMAEILRIEENFSITVNE